jgi:hypothetical protein
MPVSPRPLALLKAAHALEHVPRPADGLAVFTIVDDVEADIRLLAHNVGDAVVQARIECRLIVGLAVASRFEQLLKLHRPDQAADMRGQDSAAAAG